MGFLIHQELDDNTEMLSPLTFSPKANTASPAAKMLCAAFTSRSWVAPHSGHSHSRTSSGIVSLTNPQQEQRLLDGKNRPISTYVLPAQADLYSSCRVNSPQPASAMCLARFGFLTMFFTARFSTQITWFSLTNLRDNWCKLSERQSVIFA
ncbi:hypothetical protein SAMN05660964_03049 [Thiothrix caldifontis]|uniref:Uncharacterized protein n=1 Tax=Thiothrix caldifontis TaxID=525918 RepID=A0A1H4FMH9_9GAMM|nr:hypothetical protein SAMN05660964_03049 [Thiothrix caldifontis]